MCCMFFKYGQCTTGAYIRNSHLDEASVQNSCVDGGLTHTPSLIWNQRHLCAVSASLN